MIQGQAPEVLKSETMLNHVIEEIERGVRKIGPIELLVSSQYMYLIPWDKSSACMYIV